MSCPLCEEGACSFTCETGWGDCDGDAATGCEQNLLEDPKHCGACGLACAPGARCAEGACVDPACPDGNACPCPDGFAQCGESCVDLENDPVQCGQCGHSCEDGEVCVLGRCATCQPGSHACDGNTLLVCKTDGSGWAPLETCDEELGLVCDAAAGRCDGPCAPERLGPHDLGCEFFPTTTATTLRRDRGFEFGVSVANPGSEPAEIRITGGALSEAIAFTLAPGAIDVRTLPWVEALLPCQELLCAPGAYLVPQGAYRLKSSRPVAVHQYSPLQDEVAGKRHGNCDSSLVLPKNALGQLYTLSAWETADLHPGLIAIVATEDGTEVNVTPRADAFGADGAPDFPQGEVGSALLQRGDVLQLLNAEGDPSGGHIRATKAVQVIAGNTSTRVPSDLHYLEHLEESMLPIDALGKHYLLALPQALERPRIVRIVATQPETSLFYDPPQPDLPSSLEKTRDFVTFETSEGFSLQSNHPVLVAEYLTGSELSEQLVGGDPSLTLSLPLERYRKSHLFHTPDFIENYVQIYGPADATVWLDDVPLGELEPLGASRYGVLEVPVAPGPHRLEASAPIGIQLYGFSEGQSYWHPGG